MTLSAIKNVINGQLMVNGQKYRLINGFREAIKINGKLMEIIRELMEN